MKSNKTLSLAVIALVIINLVLIGLIWFRSDTPRDMRPQQGFHQRMLSGQLNFSPDQEKKFIALSDDFHQRQQVSAEKIYECRRMLHESIFDSSIDSDSLLDVIGKLEREHAAELLVHQREIFLLCDENQGSEFRRLTLQTIRFQGRRRGMRGR